MKLLYKTVEIIVIFKLGINPQAIIYKYNMTENLLKCGRTTN